MIRPIEAVRLSAAAAGDGESWVEIARSGSWRGHPAGDFTFDAKVYAQLVANFTSTRNRTVPVDFEHAAEMGPTGSIPQLGAPAQAWVTELRHSDDSLEALFRWVPGQPGRGYVRAGAYRYVSPAVVFSSIDRVTAKPIGAELVSVALTNRPFLDGMRPIAARDQRAAVDAMAKLEAKAIAISKAEGIPLSVAYGRAHRALLGVR